MRRRFAGEGISSTTTIPADTLAAATEALKAAQVGLKGRRGSRLGQGSQLEREEATTSKAAGSETVQPTPTAVAPTGAAPAATSDISSLRKALGIDDLLTSLRGAEASEATAMPEFEMPEFEMPKFELPDFESIFSDAFSKYAPQQSTDTANATQASTATAATPKAANKVTVGNKSYNLSKTGGSGLGSKDIKVLQQKGWSKSEIKQVATQAPRVSAGAQKILKAQTTAKNLTSNAKAAIAKASAKNSGKKK